MTDTCLDIFAFLELQASTGRFRRQTGIFEGKPLLWPITVEQAHTSQKNINDNDDDNDANNGIDADDDRLQL